MASALVGGAFLSSFLNVLFDRVASSEFINLFMAQKMDKNLLQRLQELLEIVTKVLGDAEYRHMNDPHVKRWLDNLRDTAYEADDLLDFISYEATAAKVEAKQPTIGNQGWDLFSFRNPLKEGQKDHSTGIVCPREVPKRIEEIVGRLKQLVDQIGQPGLQLSFGSDASQKRNPTISMVEESDIIGRDGEKEAIFEYLRAEDAEGNCIVIVGMGGIGKTTLAQLVYNDSRAKKLFGKYRVWICVSGAYDDHCIKRDVLKQITDGQISDQRCDSWTLEQINIEFRENLKDKRYLLVLDDLWMLTYEDWERLQAPMRSGARRGKIIVTTRNQNVASIMCAVENCHQLQQLNYESCWELFVKHAFKGGNGDQRLQLIGKEIVKKCRGLPLAAKMLGAVLGRKREVSEWEEILDSNIWDLQHDVFPTLKLSYQHLPSHLKRCFAYCALFPKDYKLEKETIIHLWMAEGFLGEEKMEQLGKKYFDELVSSSFLQKSGLDGQSIFCMHDIINDLAKYMSGESLMRMEKEQDSVKIHERIRYFSYMASEINSFQTLDNISKAQVLRTFFTMGHKYYEAQKEIANKLFCERIPHLWQLRVLSFYGYFNDTMVELPESICNLKHLRYLNLAKTCVERLPETVCTLYNLQTLVLYKCRQLVQLPKKIGNLINLHCLDIRKTKRLKETPPGMGNLKNLRILCKFIVMKQDGSNIEELGKLEHLRGALSVMDLENAMNPRKSILKNKKHLEELELIWSGNSEDSYHEFSLFERLQPHTSIQTLSIYGYGGTKFADWVGHSSYAYIVTLELRGWKNCPSLPPLGQLLSLENLSISGFDSVEKVGVEFYGSCCVSKNQLFRSLKNLSIKSMSLLQEWICDENNSVGHELFAKLEYLTLRDCPNLKSITTGQSTRKIFKSLNKFDIEDCPNLRTSDLLAIASSKDIDLKSKGRRVFLQQLPSEMYSLNIGRNDRRSGEYLINREMEGIEEMRCLFNDFDLEDIKIKGNNFLQSIPLELCPNKSLRVSNCDELKSLSAYEEHLHPVPSASLASLEIELCKNLKSFPEGGITAPNLVHLQLHGCPNLESLPDCMHFLLPSLERLKIAYCEGLESFPRGGLPVSLHSLAIHGCRRLIEGRSQWGLQTLEALSNLHLDLYEGDDLESFPEEILLPSSLRVLHIGSFLHLKLLNYAGLQHLTSLTNLTIEWCDLQCLPEEGLPSCLSVLKIWGCPPPLVKKCKRDGEDWYKISRIDTIEIDGKRV